MLKGLFVAIPLLFAAAPANAANILVNSGFESGALGPWVASSGGPIVTTAEAHTGQYSVAANGQDAIRQNFAPIATSQITELSFWAKRVGGAFDTYQFYYDDLTQSNFFLTGAGDDWAFFDVTTKLAANKNLTGFSIYGTSPGPAYLDDFTIDTVASAVPEPATWAMMIVGFGAVGTMVRSRRRLAAAA
jgi:hypothetical protein